MSAKKVAIIGHFATLMLAGAMADTVTSNKENNTTTTNASQKAIQELCQNTDYPQTCVDSLSKATNSSDPKILMKVSFELIINEVENAIKQIPTFMNSSKELIISGPNGIYATCQNFLQMSIEDLQRSIDRVNSADPTGDLTMITDDLQTYIAGANTYHESCMDCFEDDADRGGQMRELLKVARELTADGLTWANQFPNIMKRSLKS